MFETSIHHACILVILLSGVPLAVSAGFGLVAAFLQAVTQIQDQSIIYTVKVLAFLVTAFFGCGWAGRLLQEYLSDSMALVVILGGR